MENVYLPYRAEIEEIREESPDVKTFRLDIAQNGNGNGKFKFQPGQFVELSVFGVGESPFGVASPASHEGKLECSIKRLGSVTRAVHEMNEGDFVGVRGPFGNSFPLDEMKGKNVVIVGGGIGLAPLRPLIGDILENREEFRDVTILCGARTVDALIYRDDMEAWKKRDDVNTVVTVDPGGDTPGWDGKVGLIPKVLEELPVTTENSLLVTCGPPIMIHFTLQSAGKMGFQPEQIWTTLERKMQCGFGKCGHCMIGDKYICRDGPVFSYKQIKDFYEAI